MPASTKGIDKVRAIRFRRTDNSDLALNWNQFSNMAQLFAAQQSVTIIMGYYTIIDPLRRNTFHFIPSALHSVVRAH